MSRSGNALSRVHWRALGYATVRDLLVGPQIEIVTVDRRLLPRALDLYGNRPDKEWGLTDCISFVVMTDRRIKSALTFDHHFAQAGFTTLIG